MDVNLTDVIPLTCVNTGVLISPYPDQEGNKLQRQKILMFIIPIYYHNWSNISTIHIQDAPGGKVNILGGYSIGHSKQKTLYEHVSYSERFPR